MAKKENEVVLQKSNLPVEFAAEIDAYIEQNDVRDIEADEVITPRISLLQSMSKQVKKSEADYIKGAEEGMLINTLTKEVYDGATGITFVPCYSERIFNEWIPQSLGGGLLKRWGADESFRSQGYIEEKGKWQKIATDDKGKQYVASEVIKTADYYVLVINEETGAFYPAAIGFSGTKYKVHRKLINDLSLADYVKKDGSSVTPPPFFRVYNLVTIPESDGTNSWFNYKFSRKSDINSLKNSKSVWEAAKQFRALVQEGKIVASAEQQEEVRVVNHDDETTI